jgi:hypothetical protein
VIRLAWRQFRLAAVVAAVGLAALAAIVLLTHPHVADVYRQTIGSCRGTAEACDSAASTFLRTDESLRGWLGVLVVALPGLIGAFWGAPLVAREVEAGTFRLAWTQSVTRTRWLAAQLLVGGTAAVAVAGLTSWMVTWWSHLHDLVEADRFRLFDQRSVAPVGYALAAFLLGVAAGAVLRKVLPAMATTMVAIVGLRFAVTEWIRPNVASTTRLAVALDRAPIGFGIRDGGDAPSLLADPPRMPNAWIRSVEVVDRSGHHLAPATVARACPQLDMFDGPPRGGPVVKGPAPQGAVDALHSCITKLGARYHEVVTYFPARRYWSFQWIELGVYVGVAALLVGVCVWAVRRVR